jgi:hypothetical protein
MLLWEVPSTACPTHELALKMLQLCVVRTPITNGPDPVMTLNLQDGQYHA